MSLRRAAAATLGLTVAFTTASATAEAKGGHTHKRTVVYTLVENNGNPEGVAWDTRSKTFFTGTTANGTIYRGTLRDKTPEVWIKGANGRAAIGMKAKHGLLYVAGGATGTITVYRIKTKAVVARFQTGTGGFLNDLVVTKRGVFVTDSLRPVVWRVTAAQVKAGGGTPRQIAVSPEIPYGNGFALNGIVAYHGGRTLVVVHSTLGRLYRISQPGVKRTITQLTAPTVNGDGLLVDKGRLIAVVGEPARLVFLKLNAKRTAARLVKTRTDPTFERPSTIARAGKRYLVVNADFTTNTPPFTLSGIRR